LTFFKSGIKVQSANFGLAIENNYALPNTTFANSKLHRTLNSPIIVEKKYRGKNNIYFAVWFYAGCLQ
jgi:hypothetical protein